MSDNAELVKRLRHHLSMYNGCPTTSPDLELIREAADVLSRQPSEDVAVVPGVIPKAVFTTEESVPLTERQIRNWIDQQMGTLHPLDGIVCKAIGELAILRLTGKE